MFQLFQDSMAIAQYCSKPNLFITMMANPSWSEIEDNLFSYEDDDDDPDYPKKCQTASDHPDIVAHVFFQKIKSMLKDIKDGLFGDVQGYVFTIEFQKWGLPHIHLLIFLKQQYKICDAGHVNLIVSAQIPDPVTHPLLYATVTKHMMHGPCGPEFPNPPCIVNGKCSKHYTKDFCAETHLGKDGYSKYARPDNGRTYTNPCGKIFDNCNVVPYNPYLSAKYDCHINVEVCISVKAINYIHKYIYKGHDCATVGVGEHIDKILEHIGSHYIGPLEAFWHIADFPMHEEMPSVYCLPVYLPDQQTIYFNDDDDPAEVMDCDASKKTIFTEWFTANCTIPTAKQHSYISFPHHFVWEKSSESGSHAVKLMSLEGCTLFTHLQENAFISGCC